MNHWIEANFQYIWLETLFGAFCSINVKNPIFVFQKAYATLNILNDFAIIKKKYVQQNFDKTKISSQSFTTKKLRCLLNTFGHNFEEKRKKTFLLHCIRQLPNLYREEPGHELNLNNNGGWAGCSWALRCCTFSCAIFLQWSLEGFSPPYHVEKINTSNKARMFLGTCGTVDVLHFGNLDLSKMVVILPRIFI